MSESKKHLNKDVNTKFLALDAIAKLSKYTSGNNILKNHYNVILASLRDNDISIRRKALDLMFLICTEDSVKVITKEMLLYFKEDEPQLKDDIALKVAILAEKYASDLKWYVESIVKMIEMAGEYMSDDIVYRFMQVITGFKNQEQPESIQKYAVEKASKLLEKDFVNENAIRLGALLFGEFGYLLCKGDENDNYVFSKLISQLKKHLISSSNPTILMILNSLMKMTKFSQEVIGVVVPVFEDYLESWDTELQQRAVECIILSKYDDEKIPNINLVRETAFGKMPLYSEDYLSNSILMKRLSKTNKSLYSKTKEGAAVINTENKQQHKVSSSQTEEPVLINQSFAEMNLEKVSDLLASNHDVENHPFSNHIIFQRDKTAFAARINKHYENAEKIDVSRIQNNFADYKSFITNINNAGIIYTSESFQIEAKLKTLEKGVLGMMLTFTGDSPSNLELSVGSSDGIDLQISKFKYQPQAAQALVKARILSTYVQPITLILKGEFRGVYEEVTFGLPIVITKYIEYYDCKIEDYTQMWIEFSNIVSEETQRFDSIMTNPMSNSKPIMDFLKKIGGLLNSMGFKVFSPNDSTNYHEIEACGILSFEEGKLIPILLQASFVPSFPDEFRFSLRTKNKSYNQFSNLVLDIYSLVKFFVNPK